MARAALVPIELSIDTFGRVSLGPLPPQYGNANFYCTPFNSSPIAADRSVLKVMQNFPVPSAATGTLTFRCKADIAAFGGANGSNRFWCGIYKLAGCRCVSANCPKG